MLTLFEIGTKYTLADNPVRGGTYLTGGTEVYISLKNKNRQSSYPYYPPLI